MLVVMHLSSWTVVVAVLASIVFHCSCAADGRVEMSSMTEPTQCSSPGWRDAPYDISTLIGSYIHFNCRSSIPHSETVWLHGRKRIEQSPLSSKIQFYSGNTSLRYGPIGYNDSDVVIGCEVMTNYGPLPSSLGKITVLGAPTYSPLKLQIAKVGEPFEFDFNYTSQAPPSKYDWFKNGRPFFGDDHRVTTSHTGIIFTRVLQEDAGQYVVRASTPSSGSTEATATLKVAYFKSGDRVQTGSSGLPVISSKVAVAVALDRQNQKTFHVPKTSSNSYTSDYAKHVIRLYMQFRRGSALSRRQGESRLETERILRRIIHLIGLHSNYTISRSDLDKIANATNCTVAQRLVNCISPTVLKYRTADGSCNNFFYPLNGASGVQMARLLPAKYEDGISQPFGYSQLVKGDPFSPPWPSPRLISWKIVKNLTPRGLTATHMFMQWGQFVDHDLTIAPIFDNANCSCDNTERCIPMKVHSDDIVYGNHTSNKGKCLSFVRSVPACMCTGSGHLARNQINDLTSYIDASNVYGNDDETAKSLRLMSQGLLKQGGKSHTNKGNLPVQEMKSEFFSLPFFVAGDSRVNEQVGLTIMHTLWMREHNRIATALSKINPCWNDEKLYQETRKIIGAMQQVINFKEFLPTMFGSHMDTYVSPYQGYNPFIDATIPNSFAAAAYRFGHSLIRPELDRLDENYRRMDIGPLDLNRAFDSPLAYYESGGTDPITRGLTVARTNPTDEFLNRVLTSQLLTTDPDKLAEDLASLNIQRGRDHGIPTYRDWKRHCYKLFRVRSFLKNGKTIQTLKELYGQEGFNHGIDLWVGGLAERRLPGAHLGPTFACIIGLTFSRLRDGDRFWYENPYVFTPAQRYELKKTLLSKVVCTNGDNIPTIQRSIFKPSTSRENCSDLPSINLWHWWDSRCYYERYYTRGRSN